MEMPIIITYKKRYDVRRKLLNINHRLNEYAQCQVGDILYYNTKQYHYILTFNVDHTNGKSDNYVG
jgi:hypothetical protein